MVVPQLAPAAPPCVASVARTGRGVRAVTALWGVWELQIGDSPVLLHLWDTPTDFGAHSSTVLCPAHHPHPARRRPCLGLCACGPGTSGMRRVFTATEKKTVGGVPFHLLDEGNSPPTPALCMLINV